MQELQDMSRSNKAEKKNKKEKQIFINNNYKYNGYDENSTYFPVLQT